MSPRLLTVLLTATLIAPATAQPAAIGTSKSIETDDFRELVARYDAARDTFQQQREAAMRQSGLKAVEAITDQNPAWRFTRLFEAGAARHQGQKAAIPFLDWLLTARPFAANPVSKRALNVLLRDHLQHPELEETLIKLGYCYNYVGVGPAMQALATVHERSPLPAIQGVALYAQAAIRIRLGDLNEETEKEVLEQLHKALEIAPDARFARRARGCINSLENLQVGKPVPEIEGRDLHGSPFKLSDYHDRVVVLIFWSSSRGPSEVALRNGQRLMARFTNLPVSVVGVDADPDPEVAKRYLAEYGFAVRSFADGPDGPIGIDWNILGWPTVYVVDHSGNIRYRGDRVEIESITNYVISARIANLHLRAGEQETGEAGTEEESSGGNEGEGRD